MPPALTVARDLYHAMEQGNIGKLFSLLDPKFTIHGPVGTDRKGREGILDIISDLYRQGKGIKKEIDHLIEYEYGVIVLGNIYMNYVAPASTDQTSTPPVKMPFVDIWKLQGDKITELQYFYQDPPLLARFLSNKNE